MDEKEFKEIKELLEKKKKLIDTTELVHTEAYTEAAKEHLMTGDNQIDYGKLKDIGIQKKFAESMASHYLSKAKEALGVKDSKGKLEDEMLLQAYAGITSNQLLQTVGQYRHEYTITRHGQIGAKLKEQQETRLDDVVYRNVSQEHVEDVVKYVKAEKLVDPRKMNVVEARNLLGEYFTHGTIGEGVVAGTHYAKKKTA